MPQRSPLPPQLGSVFSTASAKAAGVGTGRLRNPDLTQPFRGANTVGRTTTVHERARACATRMSGRWAFCGITAAMLHGLPLPPGLGSPHRPLDVAVVAPRTPPRAEGIAGHKLTAGSFGVVSLAGLPVGDAADVWCQLAAALPREDLVAAGDFLLSGGRRHGALRPARCTMEELRSAVARYAGRRGARNLRWALARVRPGVDSRPESLLRLLLIAAGLPEPLINDPTPVGDGELLLHPDLKLAQWRVVFEYQGDGHRERERFLGDIARNELFRAAGWDVIEVTSRDLFGDREEFLRRVFAVLRRHGYRRPRQG